MAFSLSRARRVLLWTLLVGFGVTTAAAGWLAYDLLADLPDLRTLADYRPPLTSQVFDRNGTIVGEFSVERRSLASMDEIPEITKRAFVSAEDGNFFEHGGIDYRSIARAAWVDISEGRIKQGASTITMQLVKQMLLTTDRTFRRKFRQMILARELEQHFSKNEILWLYLNQIYFGQGAWGISEAARTYFDKDVSELGLSESALLAGLPQRPSEYSPVRSPKAAEKRRRYVLNRLRADGVIDTAQYAEALAHPPTLKRPAYRANMHAAGYFTEEVRRFLYDQLGGEPVLNGGLRIETTLDIDLQLAAVAAVQKGLEAHDKRQGYRGPLRKVATEDFDAAIQELATENRLLAPEGDPALD
ncbi:MAG: penicillin-binding protein, partial [bacterium]|nr:penicillin-binding protein [bacterium]